MARIMKALYISRHQQSGNIWGSIVNIRHVTSTRQVGGNAVFGHYKVTLGVPKAEVFPPFMWAGWYSQQFNHLEFVVYYRAMLHLVDGSIRDTYGIMICPYVPVNGLKEMVHHALSHMNFEAYIGSTLVYAECMFVKKERSSHRYDGGRPLQIELVHGVDHPAYKLVNTYKNRDMTFTIGTLPAKNAFAFPLQDVRWLRTPVMGIYADKLGLTVPSILPTK